MCTEPFPLGKRGRGQNPTAPAYALLPRAAGRSSFFLWAPGDPTGGTGPRKATLADSGPSPGGIDH